MKKVDTMELRELQLSELEILLEFRRVCQELGLRYFLTAGTLLGAVRHKGFIPWDDDVDVTMLRSDYERFLQEAPALLRGPFILQSRRTDPKWLEGFAKIRRTDMSAVEETFYASMGMEAGVFIDIFPMDVCPDNERDAIAFFKWRRMIRVAWQDHFATEETRRICGYTKKLALLMWQILRRTPCGVLRWLHQYLVRWAAKRGSGERLCTVDGTYSYPRETYKAEWYAKSVLLDFEGEKFAAPEKWHETLTNLYGDYMTPPPEQKRRGQHLE